MRIPPLKTKQNILNHANRNYMQILKLYKVLIESINQHPPYRPGVAQAIYRSVLIYTKALQFNT